MPKRRRSSSNSGTNSMRHRKKRKLFSKYWLPPKRKTFGNEIKELYHITKFGEEIRESGEMFRGSDGAVGGGIYFASSDHKCTGKANSAGWLVKARVLTGKAKEVDTDDLKDYTFTMLQRKGYDSIKLKGFSTGTEYVVYNKDQVELISVEEHSDSDPATCTLM